MQNVSAGHDATCGVGIDGRTYCWGDGLYGQLGFPATEKCTSEYGYGEEPCAYQPGAVADTLQFSAVAAGRAHVCALTTQGAVYCWGDDEYGQLGTYDTAASCSFGLPCAQVPVPAYLPGPLISISSGEWHSCAVHHTGIVYCWGHSSYGQAGNGYSYKNETPVVVRGGTVRFRTVAAGGAFTCGLAQDSTAYCWGNGYQGQLGDSARSFRDVALPVSGGRRFAQLTAGGAHACGLTRLGAAYCWGLGVGLGTAVALDDCSGSPCSLYPVPVSGGLVFTRIAAGAGFTCGITATASYCWGAAPGLADTADAPVSFGVRGTSGGAPFIGITAGYDHACGIAAPHDVYCWGIEYHGKLGNGPGSTSTAIPVRVAGADPPLP